MNPGERKRLGLRPPRRELDDVLDARLFRGVDGVLLLRDLCRSAGRKKKKDVNAFQRRVERLRLLVIDECGIDSSLARLLSLRLIVVGGPEAGTRRIKLPDYLTDDRAAGSSDQNDD